MAEFDLCSDLHLDFWVDPSHSPEQLKQAKLMRKLINNLLPENPSTTLVIAGDLGHYNWQNKWFLQMLKVHYRNIILVAGNHDLYMISHSIQKRYKWNSFKRLEEMKADARSIPGVYYLDGQTVECDGILFGGTGMWYDDYYATSKYFLNSNFIQDMWFSYMNDAHKIQDIPREFNRYKLFADEYALMEQIVPRCDVTVSHVAPAFIFGTHEDTAHCTFYQFDGSKLLERMQGGVWCFGHIHDRAEVMHESGCRIISNPLGYPSDSVGDDWFHKDLPEARKFRTVSVVTKKEML